MVLVFLTATPRKKTPPTWTRLTTACPVDRSDKKNMTAVNARDAGKRTNVDVHAVEVALPGRGAPVTKNKRNLTVRHLRQLLKTANRTFKEPRQAQKRRQRHARPRGQVLQGQKFVMDRHALH